MTKEKKEVRVECPLCSVRGTPISIDITKEIQEAQKEVFESLLLLINKEKEIMK